MAIFAEINEWNDESFSASAVKAFPEHAAHLVQFALAGRDAITLSRKYEQKPWSHVGPGLTALGPEDQEKLRETNEVLNRFMAAANECGCVQPHVRKSEG